jgi:tetratricopeptide (TPR) repeat protein
MRPNVWALLLILTSRVCAQTEPVPHPFVPIDQSGLPRLGETISVGELRIPPKAAKEIQRSQTALRSGDVRSSAVHLERALQVYPQSLEVHNNLGSRYIELHEYEEAAMEFQKAIDIDPRVMQPFNNLSVAFFLLRRYAEAEVAARRALDLDPHNATSRYMLGCILATEKREALARATHADIGHHKPGYAAQCALTYSRLRLKPGTPSQERRQVPWGDPKTGPQLAGAKTIWAG